MALYAFPMYKFLNLLRFAFLMGLYCVAVQAEPVDDTNLPPAMTPTNAMAWLEAYDPEVHGQIDLGNQTSLWHQAYRGLLNMETNKLEDLFCGTFTSNVVVKTTLSKAFILNRRRDSCELIPFELSVLIDPELDPEAQEMKDLKAAYGDQHIAFLHSQPTNWVQALAILRTSPVCFADAIGTGGRRSRLWTAAEQIAEEAPEKAIMDMLDAHEPLVRVYGMMANGFRFGYRDWEKIKPMLKDETPIFHLTGSIFDRKTVGRVGGEYYLRMNTHTRTGRLDPPHIPIDGDFLKKPPDLMDALPEDLDDYARSYLRMK